MAEGEAEQAFLQAQTEAAEHNQTEGQQAGSSDSDDYDPSKTLQDEYSASVPDPKQDDENTPSAAPDQTIKSEPPPAAEPVQQPKTKTIGGFVVEDEDGDGDADEDEDGDDQKDADYEPPGVLDVEYVNTTSVNIPQQQTSPENPNQSSSTPDVSLQGAEQDSAGQDNVPNSSCSSSVPAPKNDVSSAQAAYLPQQLQPEQAPESPSSASVSSPPTASRGRLPHDRVGILEDRVHEDPRGDIPAWLELINEHTSRNKINNARGVFERFLKIFPSAVSILFLFLVKEN